MVARKGNCGYIEHRLMSPLDRFRQFCRFEPETGCVVWTGGQTRGRGHSVPYPAFWFEGKRWGGHRWAAKYIHGIDIDMFQADHCCPNIPIPNTLCVEHVQPLSLLNNVYLQHERRRRFVHLQVGLLDYFDVYGHEPGVPILDDDAIPFYDPPAWLTQGVPDAPDCPF